MRQGTPGFVGERLTEAREVNGLTQVALVRLLGESISTASVSQYETGATTPSPQVLNMLASRLGFPSSFFFRGETFDDNRATFFRSKASASGSAKRMAGWKLRWAGRVVSYLDAYLELPGRANLVPVPVDPSVFDQDLLEDAATSLRRHWGLGDGAISDLVLLAENQGFIISRQRLFEQREDALSRAEMDGVRDYILINADKASTVRSRFDLAHEIAHMTLHRHLTESQRRAHHAMIEKQAHHFASAFLLPAERFASQVHYPSLDLLLALKERWKVSVSAMTMRCRALGLIDEPGFRNLRKQLSWRGWTRREPLDDSIQAELPRLLPRAFSTLFDAGLQRPEDVGRALALPAHEVERVAGLKEGTLSRPNILDFSRERS